MGIPSMAERLYGNSKGKRKKKVFPVLFVFSNKSKALKSMGTTVAIQMRQNRGC